MAPKIVYHGPRPIWPRVRTARQAIRMLIDAESIEGQETVDFPTTYINQNGVPTEFALPRGGDDE